MQPFEETPMSGIEDAHAHTAPKHNVLCFPFSEVTPSRPLVTEAAVWGHLARNTCSADVDNRRPV